MFGMIPIGDVIFGKKGAVTELVTGDEETKNTVTDTIHSAINAVTPHFPSPSEWLGVKDKLKDIAAEMHQQALLTPDPNDDKIDFLKYMYEYADRAPLTHFMPTWFKDIMIYFTALFNQVAHNSVQFVFKHVYKFVTEIVLFTPEWIFNNEWFPDVVSKFSTLSIGTVVVFTMIEGIKKICNMSHTPFRETLKKFPIALGVSAATPFLFTGGLKLLNKVTDLILSLSSDTIGATTTANSIFSMSLAFEPINIVIMGVFLLIVSFLCVPMILFNARRWFNLTILGLLTPLAMSAWLFNSTEGYFHQWLRAIKNLGLIQLVYAVFISVLGIIMFATPNPVTMKGVLAKALLEIGGIHALAFPPQFIKRFNISDEGSLKTFKHLKEYKEDKTEKIDKYKGTTEKALIKGSAIAGKITRLFKK